MDNNSLNILVEAKREYLQQLYLIMVPTMIEVFALMYEESHKASHGKKVLVQFQKFLKEVVNWNDHMINQHANTICSSCAWFDDLLAAVFVSSVKILSSVRLNAESNKISLKLPNNKVFVHGCFIAASKDLYKNPYIYHEESVEQDRDMELTGRFSKCIEDTVKDLIPIQEILKSCISQVNREEPIDFENTSPEDTEDPDLNEEMEMEDEGEGECECEENEPMNVEEEEEEPKQGEEPKNIQVVGKTQERPKEADEDDGILFKDAKEEQKENKP
jgi:hypothetical protein